ncbi:MAG: GntR family transcriptional regulator [Burkholderiaceae bacterium]
MPPKGSSSAKQSERIELSSSKPDGVTLASYLTDHLRSDILNGVLSPGSKVRIDALRAQFGISLSPVREALSRLAAQGLVIGQENHGFRISEVSRENIAEITSLRCNLEGLAIEASVRNGDDEWEDRLVAIFHRLTRIEQRSDEFGRLEEWEIAHSDFHMALISACGMPLLLMFCEVLHDHNNRYRRLFLKKNPSQRNVAQEHKQIMDAVLARDAERAKELLQKHVARTGKGIYEVMPPRQELQAKRRRSR